MNEQGDPIECPARSVACPCAGRRLRALAVWLLLATAVLGQRVDPFASLERRAAASPAKQGVEVEVLDPEWETVEGASVGFLPFAQLHQLASRRSLEDLGHPMGQLFSRIAWASKHGRKFRTGKNGRVTLPNDQAGYLVAVWSKDGKRYAATKDLRSGAEDLELDLAPLEEVLVRVVDERGQPVSGLPLSVSPWGDAIDRGGFVVAWTGSKGLAYLPWQWLRRMGPGIPGGAGGPTFGVVVVGGESVARSLDPAEGIPEDIIELQMPPFGQVKVIVYGEDGKPRDGVRNGQISLEGRFRQGLDRGSWSAPIFSPDGVTFPAVALHQEYEVELSLNGSPGRVTVSGAGPQQSRELVIMTPRAEVATVSEPTLSVRILDRSGEPVEAEGVGITFVDARQALGFERTTDEQGRLEVVVPQGYRESDETEIYLTRRCEEGGEVSFSGQSLTLPEELPAARFDLGDCQLDEVPVQLAGRVVDEQGQPLSGVSIQVRRVFDGRHEMFVVGGGLFGRFARTDAEGRFELRHTFEEMSGLEVTLEGYYLEEMPDWSRGDTDLEFVMARAGKVVASIKDPPGPFLRLTLVGEADPQQTLRGTEHPTLGEAHRTWMVPPGTYKLCLSTRLSYQAEEDVVVDQILVEAGQEVQDRRLQDIDWTNHLAEREIEVVDEQANPVTGAALSVYWRSGDAGRWHPSMLSPWSGENTVDLLVREDMELVVHVRAEGYVDFLAEDVKADLKAVMVRRERVEATLEGDLELPEDMRLGITLVQETETQKRLRESPVQMRDPNPELFLGGVARPFLEGGGDCEIWLTLVRARPERGGWSKKLRVSHYLPNFKVTEEALREGLKIPVDDDLRDEIEIAVEQLQER
ncbi:MAG: carboxypeptidase-like regulatory domain-containing protein [Planctomycetota bacterium]|nr:carboxypeptidase-like regulatory domain-containing protein [Planctomycetota bacterium]